MGLLPSQKYDFILWDFCNWIKEEDDRLSYLEKGDFDKLIKEFLKLLDNNEWENKNPKNWGFTDPFILEKKFSMKGVGEYEKISDGRDK